MDTKKLLHYLSFMSLRSLFSGKKTRREIMTVIMVLIVMRVAIYGIMTLSGFHPMNMLAHLIH